MRLFFRYLFVLAAWGIGAIFPANASYDAAVTSSPANYTALWWNASEPGWGINVSHQGDIAFATLFTYDATGTPLWLVMSSGTRQGASDTFAGDLYRTTGPVFNASPFTPIGLANVTRVGSMTLVYSGANAGTLTYGVNGVNVTKTIEKQVYGSRAAVCEATTGSRASATNYQDLWFNATESGWGVNITHQDETLFATLFTYGADNRGLWLVMSSGTRQADGSYFGALYRASGPQFDAQPWTGVSVTQVGTMRLRFTSGTTATLDYSVNDVAVSKSITRQEFSSPLTLCAGTATNCSYSLSANSATFDSSGGSGSIAVSASSGCDWTATSNTTWVTVTGGSTGTGAGTVSYSVQANTGAGSRTATLAIAGQIFTITQAGSQVPSPPADNSDCTTFYVHGRVLTLEVTNTGSPVTSTIRRSFGPDTTFLGQSVQQVVDQTTSFTTSFYIQDLPAEWIELGWRSVSAGGESTTVFQPSLHSPKQWPIGQSGTYSGQLISGPLTISTQITQTLERREAVTVPAGTFDTCVFHAESTATSSAGVARSSSDTWVAPGVGEVKPVAKDQAGAVTVTHVLRQLQ